MPLGERGILSYCGGPPPRAMDSSGRDGRGGGIPHLASRLWRSSRPRQAAAANRVQERHLAAFGVKLCSPQQEQGHRHSWGQGVHLRLGHCQ